MKMSAFALAALLALAVPTVAADRDSAVAGSDCAAGGCRAGGTSIDVEGSDGQSYTIPIPRSPYVMADGSIVIYPGETLIFRFAPTQDGPGAPVFVKRMERAAPTRLLSDSPGAEKYHDPKTGEDYYIARGSDGPIEGGTARDHLKDQPPGTVIVSYQQAVGRADMVLTVEHNLGGTLKYDALIERLSPSGSMGLAPTSTCPVLPVMIGTETWPYPIATITLGRFRFVQAAGFRCE